MEVISAFVSNIVILFGLIFLVGLSNRKLGQRKLVGKIVFGILIGFGTIIIMINSWELYDGAIFDARSVSISVTTLFFPYSTSIIASIIAIIYRISVGGDGVYAGTLTIGASFLIGVLWKKYLVHRIKNKYLSFYLFGLVVHIAMLLCQLAFPSPTNIEIIRKIGPIVLLGYPVAVMLISVALKKHDDDVDLIQLIEKSELKYRTLVQNSKLGIMQYNTSGIIEVANQEFASILGTKLNKLIGLNMLTLPNEKVVESLKQSLSGKSTFYEGEYVSYLSNKTFYARIQFSPVIFEGEITGGIGLLYDLTQQETLRQSVEELSSKDLLTKLLNRSAFDKFLFNENHNLPYPITMSMCGINKFTIINTSFGYETGNSLLLEIANLLLEFERTHPGCLAYRIGGDQFALVMPNTTYEEADGYTAKLKAQINAIEKFEFDVKVSCGLGTALTKEESMVDTFTKAYENKIQAKVYEGSSLTMRTVDIIMKTLFMKNSREELHSQRVSKIARLIAEQFELGASFANKVELAGKLHDIGKITIAEEIIDKPGKLNNDEWSKIKKHSETGYMILSSVPEYLDLAHIVNSHHERWDGTGYPRGLKKNESPLEARIISVADAYDAMTVSRPYRAVVSSEEAIEEIKRFSGIQFDPEVVEKIVYLYRKNML